jgi:hypothetical protein
MILKTGDMWSVCDEADLFLFTANSTLNSKGELVMGRGMAKQVKERIDWLPKDFGDDISRFCGSGGEFFLLLPRWKDINVGAFQVKFHWKEPADTLLIAASTVVLNWWARSNRSKAIHLNYPGIGNGGLAVEQVEPIIAVLPDNVTVWKYE